MNKIKPFTNAVYVVIFLVLSLLCVLPVLFTLIISFSSEASVAERGYSFIPADRSLDAYAYLWAQRDSVGRSLLNSVFVTVCGTALGLFLISTLGYCLSRLHFSLRPFILWVVFIPMLFQGGLVATYVVNTQLYGLKNTYGALILPLACSSFYVLIMRTFFQNTVPEAVIESGRLDGASHLRVFFSLVLPVSLPALATIALFLTFAYWNDWYQALLYLQSTHRQLYPLQYLLISIERSVDFLSRSASGLSAGSETKLPSETVRMAIVMVVVTPIALSYPFFQKYFVSGLTIGAVKG